MHAFVYPKKNYIDTKKVYRSYNISIDIMIQNFKDESQDLRSFGIKSSEGRTLYEAMRRLIYSRGRVFDIADLAAVMLLSKKGLAHAISELQKAGIISVDTEAQTIQLVG